MHHPVTDVYLAICTVVGAIVVLGLTVCALFMLLEPGIERLMPRWMKALAFALVLLFWLVPGALALFGLY